PPAAHERVFGLARDALRGGSTETRVVRALLPKRSLIRRAFGNPRGGGIAEDNEVPGRRAELGWASPTGRARALARAYLPFAAGGGLDGRNYLGACTLEPVYAR